MTHIEAKQRKFNRTAIQGWDRAENTRFVVADIGGHRTIKFWASALLVVAFDLRLCGRQWKEWGSTAAGVGVC